jgi:hypothetical protein
MKRVLCLMALLLCGFVTRASLAQVTKPSAPSATAKSDKSLQRYRAELKNTERALQRWSREGVALPDMEQLRKVFPSDVPRIIRRSDGSRQTVTGDEWTRRLDEIEYSRNGVGRVSRRHIRGLRDVVMQRRKSLEAWARDAAYVPANAQSIVRSLEQNGEIRVAPTWSQQTWQNIKDAVGDFYNNLFRGGAAAPTPPVETTRPGLIFCSWELCCVCWECSVFLSGAPSVGAGDAMR